MTGTNKVLLFILVVCQQCFIGQTTKKNDQISYLPVDSVKYLYEKGDKIIFNNWLLTGPDHFFDSVSINKNSFKAFIMNKDSAVSHYGNFGSSHQIVQVKIPSLEILPFGYFLDTKILKYLTPESQMIYLINGNMCTSYVQAMDEIINKKINAVSQLDPNGARKLWGTDPGKDGALIVNTDNSSVAQRVFRSVNSKSICGRLNPSDSQEYYSNKINYTVIDTNNITINKVNGVIKVPFKDSVLKYSDDTTDENFFQYKIAGQDDVKKWVLIRGEDYNQDYYYLVDQKNNKIDILVGYPMIFGDEILCQEGAYTDSPNFIEVWKSVNGGLKLISKFSLNECKIYAIDDLYLKGETLFLKTESNGYLKLKTENILQSKQ